VIFYLKINKKMKVHNITLIIIFFIICSCAQIDDSTVSGPKTVQLRNYEIASPVMERIIDDVIIPDLNSKWNHDGYMVVLGIIPENGQDCLYAESWQTDFCFYYIKKNWGWFKRGSYQFIIEDSAKKYFRKTEGKHLFEYEYVTVPEVVDEMQWEIGISDNSYSVIFVFRG